MSDVLELENEIYQDEPEQSTEQVEEEFIAPVLNQHNGVERGKFRSLTLINWNGFFARTFDLDELVILQAGGLIGGLLLSGGCCFEVRACGLLSLEGCFGSLLCG